LSAIGSGQYLERSIRSKPAGVRTLMTLAPVEPPPRPNAIHIRGARVHNLKDVDLDVPRDQLVVVTGVSGSGKSSLVFDTLHAESQRRYIESLSSYARQFVDQLERPDVDVIDGLPPTVAVDQRSGAASPRSTVATLTEIHDYLRVLYARTGTPHCPNCGHPIQRQTPEQMVATVMAIKEGRKLILLAPIVRGRKGSHLEAFQAVRRAGLIRARVDGEILDLGDTLPRLAKTKTHDVEAVVDRLVVREGIRPRLAESIDLALKLGEGRILLSVQTETGWEDVPLSVNFACLNCGRSFEELEPRTFSFNSPHGACPTCGGLGVVRVPEAETDADELQEDSSVTCPDCHGSRLRPEARAVRVAGRTLPEVLSQPVSASHAFFSKLVLPESQEPVGRPLLREIVARLGFLKQVGLGYLTLDRGANTLSGGELQRVRLASRIGSGLVGACYVVDEPTAGLHPRDTGLLLESLRALRDHGNSVIVVEHDEAVIRAADWLIDIGPGAGPEGGHVVAQGSVETLEVAGISLTADYLRRTETESRRESGRLAGSPGQVTITNASARNLKKIEVSIPLGAITCVCGVSGSGKSTLVHDVLARAARRFLNRRADDLGTGAKISGLDAFDKLIEVDQSPIGRGPRSTPSTATGLFDEIRRLYARTREAKVRGYKASRFSFNARGGRCEACEGQGVRKVSMSFLADMFVRCEVCAGKRFNPQTLEVRFKGKSIGDVLETRVDEALVLFDAQPKIKQGLASLHDAGLGYLTLGQPSTTLSGGEAQRVKLAAELGRSATGRTLFLLDEPTTGLHFADVDRLLALLSRLADAGNTIVVIEHNLNVLKSADWLIDLGPEGGENGGRVLATGAPLEVARSPESVTGRLIRPLLGLGP
jgi:excinuclease ABC subunit A